jgi:hypothetical protein
MVKYTLGWRHTSGGREFRFVDDSGAISIGSCLKYRSRSPQLTADERHESIDDVGRRVQNTEL